MQPPLFRTANTPTLHDQAAAFWENSKAHHIRPATITEDQLAALRALIEEDSTAITHADALEIHDRWDALLDEIATDNGHLIPALDGITIAFCPFTSAAALVQIPEQ